MKKSVILLFIITFLFPSLFGQNEYKIPINQMLPGGNNYYGEHHYFQVKNNQYQKLLGENLIQAGKQCLDSVTIKFYNHFTEEWEPIGMFQFTYDGVWNMISEVDYSWDENIAQWSIDFKQDYSYDSTGKISRRIDYSPGDSLGQWVYTRKVDYTYNVLGNRTQEIYFNWDTTISQWMEYNKGEYIYDVTGKLTEKFYYYWNISVNQWVYNFKYEFGYDSTGNVIQMLLYQWSESTSHWVDYFKFIYTHDGYGKVIQKIKYQWYESYGQWREKDREDNIYDSLGNLTQNIQYYWIQVAEIWELDTKGEYSYNNDFMMDDLILPNYFFDDGTAEMYFQHKLFEMNFSVWNSYTGLWQLNERHSLYYSEVNITFIPEIIENSLKIYPNPADEYIQIDTGKSLNHSKFVMYDLQGRKVQEKQISPNNQLYIGHLKSGLYLYHLIQDEQVQTGKIIIK